LKTYRANEVIWPVNCISSALLLSTLSAAVHFSSSQLGSGYNTYQFTKLWTHSDPLW